MLNLQKEEKGIVDIPKSATYETIAEMDLSCSWSRIGLLIYSSI